ncbi:MAG: EF-hand domain-containing protein [Sphingomonadales bacterium]|nr:EF-hand domain-containing protein [Sphingomonadales bacterium]
MSLRIIAAAGAILIATGGIANADDRRHGYGPVPGAFFMEELDLDGDGRITRGEFDSHRASRFSDADTDNSGSLDADEMSKAADVRREERRARREAAKKARMFSRLDADKSGTISPDEFSTPADKAFARMDRDGDGVVTSEEAAFHAGMRAGGRHGKHGRYHRGGPDSDK